MGSYINDMHIAELSDIDFRIENELRDIEIRKEHLYGDKSWEGLITDEKLRYSRGVLMIIIKFKVGPESSNIFTSLWEKKEMASAISFVVKKHRGKFDKWATQT